MIQDLRVCNDQNIVCVLWVLVEYLFSELQPAKCLYRFVARPHTLRRASLEDDCHARSRTYIAYASMYTRTYFIPQQCYGPENAENIDAGRAMQDREHERRQQS